MEEPIIKVEKLGKKYRIGESQPYYSLRDSIAGLFRPGRKSSPAGTIWALKNVSFEVQRGEVVGIIGRNGAGKSTLLKILSQITPPTTGKVTMRGRVGSLLEVGTGFHPELTGRENIYLNGAILGMSQREIRKKFDEIVAFSEIEKFLDTPVKHYSSGMYVRLAFAVAAHLEPEILLVDEVLAVGDVSFQKKCLGKMGEVARGGRTVIFVSHNMAAVRHLCPRSIYLKEGRAVTDAATDEVVARYLEDIHGGDSMASLISRTNRRGTGVAQFTHVAFERSGKPSRALVCGEEATFVVGYKGQQSGPVRSVNIAIGIDNQVGERIFALSTEYTGQTFKSLPPQGSLRVTVPKLPLAPGRYSMTLYMTIAGEVADWVEQAGFFVVESGDFFGTGRLSEGQGSILVNHRFELLPHSVKKDE
jgi:lipopolysaccharide transport system ATP-binding protein